MTYEQLERCYKTVIKQRNDAEDKIAELNVKIDHLASAFNSIKKHQEVAVGEMAKLSATWQIADRAIKAT